MRSNENTLGISSREGSRGERSVVMKGMVLMMDSFFRGVAGDQIILPVLSNRQKSIGARMGMPR